MLFKKKTPAPPYVAAVVAAGGSGTRMGENKLLMELGGMPVLARTLRALENSALVREVVIAAREDQIVAYADLAAAFECKKVVKVVKGGETRAESVYRACCEVSPQTAVIAVQDAARPLTTPAEIDAVIRAALEHGSALAAAPVHDTMKRADGQGRVSETVAREHLFRAQTPQAAGRAVLVGALKSALDAGVQVTDECMALERLGVRPAVVPVSGQNLKLTAPEDVPLAEAILQMREEA